MTGQNLFMQSFTSQRSEDDIVAQTPFVVKLGGTDYNVKPLTIKAGRAWRGKLSDVLNEMATGPLTTQLTPQNFVQGLMVAFFTFPDKVLGLMYAYSPELEAEKEAIEDKATDEETVVAFSRILAVAYPFFNLLGSMKTAASAAGQAISPR